jgi:hypothetical protein
MVVPEGSFTRWILHYLVLVYVCEYIFLKCISLMQNQTFVKTSKKFLKTHYPLPTYHAFHYSVVITLFALECDITENGLGSSGRRAWLVIIWRGQNMLRNLLERKGRTFWPLYLCRYQW